MSLRIVMSTAPDAAAADRIARVLVEERLAACVSVLPEARSVYRWRGAIETATEQVLIAKTTAERVPTLLARLKELHPYEVPEGVTLVVDAALPAYARWVAEETAPVIF